jgi:hypothetical protein
MNHTRMLIIALFVTLAVASVFAFVIYATAAAMPTEVQETR